MTKDKLTKLKREVIDPINLKFVREKDMWSYMKFKELKQILKEESQ